MQPLIEITAAEQIDEEIVDAFAHLIPQLSPGQAIPGRRHLEEIARSGSTVLLLARRVDTQAIVGTATLVLYRVPSGMRATIEDVVVEVAARGYGVGEALVREALARAAEGGAEVVDLTSHASRTAANRLYMKLGFNTRQTNAYRCDLTRTESAARAQRD
jgi:ribosomal protein S18 acetylase RimI-like enzyme